MTFDELIARIATEPNRVFERDLRIPSPELLADMHKAGGMMVEDYLSDRRHTIERRSVRVGHVIGPPLSTAALSEWRARSPRHPLPDDLVALLLRANGIHLWADLDHGRSYEGLAPIEEWDLAREKLWGPGADETWLDDRYLAISYHADNAAFIVLRVDTGHYFLMDSSGADETSPIGRSVGELLDWVWKNRIPSSDA